jgi:hypothetical protein
VSQPFVIELDDCELWVLLSLQGPGLTLGVADPFVGMLARESEATARSALERLVSRGLALQVSSDEIALRDEVAALIAACHHPNHSLIVQSQRAGEPQRHLFVHYAPGVAVEHDLLEQHRHRLSVLTNRDDLLARLMAVFPMQNGGGPTGGSVRVAEEALLEARTQFARRRDDRALEALREGRDEGGRVADFAEALRQPMASVSFVLVANRNQLETQLVRGFSVLAGERQTWILLPFEALGRREVECVLADRQAVRQRLSDLLQ